MRAVSVIAAVLAAVQAAGAAMLTLVAYYAWKGK